MTTNIHSQHRVSLSLSLTNNDAIINTDFFHTDTFHTTKALTAAILPPGCHSHTVMLLLTAAPATAPLLLT